MEWLLALPVGYLVYLAFAFDVLGFSARDELALRSLMLAASVFYIAYFFVASDAPLWEAIYADVVLMMVNLFMIGIVVRERSTRTMSDDAVDLYRWFPRMSPGHFRRLMRTAERRRTDGPREVTHEYVALECLYFILEGEVTITKAGTATTLPAKGLFIGEVAFLAGVPASATVTLAPGSEYLVWQVPELHRLSKRLPDLGNALIAHLSEDMAQKVAFSQPSQV